MTRPDFITGQRIRALEARTGRLEENAEADQSLLYKLHRSSVRDGLRWSRLMDHLGVPDVTDTEVDAALDGQ